MTIAREDFVTTREGGWNRITKESAAACKGKVRAFLHSNPPGSLSFTIERDFERVYATSDIHADLPKLIQIIVSAGLVAIEEPTGDVYEDVWRVTWVARDTLFVVCGDLIDGRRPVRGGPPRDVKDPRGSFEMLMHCMLFNLRIQAHALGSDIRFVLGNHEIVALFNYPTASGEFRSGFVCEAHTRFADAAPIDAAPTDALESRASLLLPFCMCSPFLLIRVGSVLFTHGGFVATSGGIDVDIYERTVGAQRSIDAAVAANPHDVDAVADIISRYRFAMVNIERTVVLSAAEVRGYAELSLDAMCGRSQTIALSNRGIELVVVGHCVTHGQKALAAEFKAMCPVDGEEAGCVVTRGCSYPSASGPKRLTVALVDTGMASCFRADQRVDNAQRAVSILALIRQMDDEYILATVAGNEGVTVTGNDALYRLNRAWVVHWSPKAYIVPIRFDRLAGSHV
jgi:hypothetical protein